MADQPSTWLTILLGGGLLAALGGIWRMVVMRRPETRKLVADAALVEASAKTQEGSTIQTGFSMAKDLIDKLRDIIADQDKRIERLDNRIAHVEAVLETERTERAAAVLLAAQYRQRASDADELQREVVRLRTELIEAREALDDGEETNRSLKEQLAVARGETQLI